MSYNIRATRSSEKKPEKGVNLAVACESYSERKTEHQPPAEDIPEIAGPNKKPRVAIRPEASPPLKKATSESSSGTRTRLHVKPSGIGLRKEKLRGGGLPW